MYVRKNCSLKIEKKFQALLSEIFLEIKMQILEISNI